MLTILIVCAFIVLLDSLMALSPMFIQNPYGDIDVTVTVRMVFEEKLISGNRKFNASNQIEDEHEKYKRIKNNKLSSYFINDPNREIDYARRYMKSFIDNPSNFVTNVTLIENKLKSSNYTKDLIEGVFGRITLPWRVGYKDQSSPAILLIIDTKKEVDIGVAQGFPSEELSSNEMYVSQSITNLFQSGKERLDISITGQSFQSMYELSQSSNNKSDATKLNNMIDNFIDIIFEEEIKSNPLVDNILKEFPLLNTTQFDLGIIKNIIKDRAHQFVFEGEKYSQNNTTKINFDNFKLNQTFNVKEIISDVHGKWPIYYGNVVIIDYKAIKKVLKSNLISLASKAVEIPGLINVNILQQNLFKKTLDFIDKISDFWMQAHILFKDRSELLYNEDVTKMKIILEKIGVELSQNFTLTSPIIENMEKLKMFIGMQDSSFIWVIMVLGLLSGIVIYSLLLFDIDERRYEMGMLRTLGMNKTSIIMIMINQAFWFSIPGIALGIVAAWLLYLISYAAIFYLTFVYIPYTVKTSSIIMGMSFCIVLPLISNILPIRHALSGSLRESLDIVKQNLTDFKVMKIRLDEIGISPSQLCLAIMLIVMGILTYYVAPLSFLDGNVRFFTFILNLVIIMMILGLSFSAQVAQPLFEKYVLLFLIKIFYKNSDKFKRIILTNLRNHRIRNTKTGIMFTITLAFLMFGTWNFDYIGAIITAGIREAIGSDISILKLSDFKRHESQHFTDPTVQQNEEYGLKEQELTKTLNELKEKGYVHSFSFLTPDLANLMGRTTGTGVSTEFKVRLMNAKGDTVMPKIFGIDENLLESISSELYFPVSENSNFTYDKIASGQRNTAKKMYEISNKDIKIWEKGAFDPKGILSYFTGVSNTTNTETFHIIIPESLKWLMAIDAGDNRLNTANICYGRSNNVPFSIGRVLSTENNNKENENNNSNNDNEGNNNEYNESKNDSKTKRELQQNTGVCGRKWKANVIVSAKKIPGFMGFTGFKIGAFDSDVLFPISEYAKIYRMTRFKKKLFDSYNPHNYTYNIPKTKLFVSLVNGLSSDERQIVKNQLSSIVDSKGAKFENTALVIDTIEQTEKVRQSMVLLVYLNTVISWISFTLAFFLLIISIAGNIRDSTYEIAVLRAIGMKGTEIVNVYVLEALSNNIASIILGFLVGVSVSATLGAQYYSLMEIPFQLLLPYKLIALMISVSILLLFIGTYYSTKSIGMKSIAGILKSGSI